MAAACHNSQREGTQGAETGGVGSRAWKEWGKRYPTYGDRAAFPRGKLEAWVGRPLLLGSQTVGQSGPWPKSAMVSCPGKTSGSPRDSGFQSGPT